MRWARRMPFQVDIAGVIEIMRTAFHCRPESAIQVIQNAHDAVARRRGDLTPTGRIDVEQDMVRHTRDRIVSRGKHRRRRCGLFDLRVFRGFWVAAKSSSG